MRILVVILLLILTSCDYFNDKKLSKEDILNEEMQTIDWHDVDEYPSFKICDSTVDDSEKRQCFETTLRKTVMQTLSDHVFIVDEDINETINLTLHIDRSGKILIKTIDKTELLQRQLPKLDSILQLGIDALPKIYPAIKRSQQVNTEFILPIQIELYE